MKTALALLPLAVGVAAFTGCASIVSGSSETVTFHSNPEGADVTIDGRPIGRTPTAILLKRKDGQNVTFSKDGYKPVTMPITTKTNGWFWGNIIFGGFVGSTTDSISGAIDEYAPNSYMTTLEPEAAGRLEAHTRQEPDQKAREFIVMGYRNIATDVRAGKGEYLDSLLNLLDVPKEDRAAATKRLVGFVEAYPDIPDFADRVLDAYRKGGAVVVPAVATVAQPDGNWDALRDGGALGDVYRYLTTDDFSDAKSKAVTLSESRRHDLADYIVGNSGQKSMMSWDFKMNPTLTAGERQFVSWYLSTYTAYKIGY